MDKMNILTKEEFEKLSIDEMVDELELMLECLESGVPINRGPKLKLIQGGQGEN